MKGCIKKFLTVLHIILLLIIAVAIIASFYIKECFPMVTIDELYFYWTNGVTNSSDNVFIAAFNACYIKVLLVFAGLVLVFYDITFGHLKLSFLTKVFYRKRVTEKIDNKKHKVGKLDKTKSSTLQFYPVRLVNSHRIIATIITIIISGYIIFANLDCIKFIKNTSSKSKFIEINYVDPKDAPVKFSKKRNLIFIIVESMETSFFTKEQGGYWDYEVIPDLYKLLNEDDTTVFYNNDIHEQMNMMVGTTWTTAGVVSNTTGLPFKIPISGNDYHSDNFMNGAYALGDMLKDYGYYNELISTARTNFGGIKEYYTKHGGYNIIDTSTLGKYGYSVTYNDKNNWGFSDRLLFDIAKSRLKKLSKNDQPFNLQLITIDTHFPDGHKYGFTTKKHKSRYENVYATSSKLIYDFVSWVKTQDFYKDTTIVILGDHISMQEEFFAKRNIPKEGRFIYNCYINSAVKPYQTENRIYTELDTYPTTIAAMGGEIKGNRLALGVNLFSKQKTLPEKYGLEFFNGEIEKKSIFYNKKILDSDYDKMIKSIGIIDEDE